MENEENTIQRIGSARTDSNRKNKKYFAVGIIIVIFALIGFASVIGGIVYSVISLTKDDDKYSSYSEFLTPVASVDPDTFDDIEKADMSQLLNIAIQSVIKADDTPDKYDYSDGYMKIPQSDVETAFVKYFGSSVTVQHQNIEGYGFSFTYDKTNKLYKIPVTAISPIYTPKIENVKKSKSSLEIIVGMVYAEKYEQNADGSMTVPEPDKYLKITMLEQNDGYYISSIQDYTK